MHACNKFNNVPPMHTKKEIYNVQPKKKECMYNEISSLGPKKRDDILFVCNSVIVNYEA